MTRNAPTARVEATGNDDLFLPVSKIGLRKMLIIEVGDDNAAEG